MVSTWIRHTNMVQRSRTFRWWTNWRLPIKGWTFYHYENTLDIKYLNGSRKITENLYKEVLVIIQWIKKPTYKKNWLRWITEWKKEVPHLVYIFFVTTTARFLEVFHNVNKQTNGVVFAGERNLRTHNDNPKVSPDTSTPPPFHHSAPNNTTQHMATQQNNTA